MARIGAKVRKTIAPVRVATTLAELKSSGAKAAWRPIHCAGFDLDEQGVKHYHHIEMLQCDCPPGPHINGLWSTNFETGMGGGRGSGKGQPLWAKVLTPYGWRPMGDLRVGHQICNPDGSVATIIAVHELGEREIFRVTCSDGAVTHVTDDHLWLAKLTNRNPTKADRRYFPFEEDDRVGYRVFTTKWLREYIKAESVKEYSEGNYWSSNVLIPLAKALKEFPVTSASDRMEVDPYVLGVLLGDGCLVSGNGKAERYPSFTSADQEIADEVIQRTGVRFDHFHPYEWRTGRRAYGLRRSLKHIGVWGKYSYEKSVPRSYMDASASVRLEVLRGLMDTDGTVDKSGRAGFTSTSKQLALDVQELVNSLGGRATLTGPHPAHYLDKEGERVQCRETFDLYIQAPKLSEFFRLKRKKDRCVDEFNGGQCELRRRIVSIEPAGTDVSRCIQVDHPNQLYITDDYIVTHNSTNSYGIVLRGNPQEWATGSPADVSYINHPQYTFLVIRKNSLDLDAWFREFRQIVEPMGAQCTENPMRVRFPSGAEGSFGHLDDPEVYMKYQGKSFTRIFVEEAGQIAQETTYLKALVGSCRSAIPELHAQIWLTFNPGGPGARWINARFRFPHAGNNPWPYARPYKCKYTGRTRVLYHSTVYDNPYFLVGNAEYVKTLEMYKETDPTLYAQWLLGDFDVVPGAFFPMFRKERRITEPENAVHVIPPRPLAQWWPRAIGLDWGFSHPAGMTRACWTPERQLIVEREAKFQGKTCKEIGAEIARINFSTLEALPSHHMNCYLSHDCFHVDGRATEASQIAEGINEVLGAGSVFILAPNEDEVGMDAKAQWESVQRRQRESGNRTAITLVKAGGGSKRRMGYNLARDYMRWASLTASAKFDEEYAKKLMLTDGALAYIEYKSSFDKAAAEKLPVLQIFNTCPFLIGQIVATQTDPNNSEEPLKQDDDDVIDSFVHISANFPFANEAAPRDVQIQAKLDRMGEGWGAGARELMREYHTARLAPVNTPLSIPRMAGPSSRRAN